MKMLALNLMPDAATKTKGRGAPLAGLDLGTSSLKVVALERDGKGYALAGLHFRESPDPGEDFIYLLSADKSAKPLAQEAGFPVRDVAFALSGAKSNIRSCEFPKMSPAAFRKCLPLEIEQYLPVNVKESVIDGQILGDSKTEFGKMDVVLAAGHAEAARILSKVVRHLGCEPRVVDAEALALANMFAYNYGGDRAYRGPVCLINAGRRLTSVVIFEGGEFRFNKPVEIGGEMLTKDLIAEYRVAPDQAEALKRDQGDQAQRIMETIGANLGKIVVEVKRCFDFYETKLSPSHNVGRILLGGGGARLQGFDRFLSDKLSVPVEFLDPFRKIRGAAKAPGAKLADRHGAAFGVAVGLAMRKAR